MYMYLPYSTNLTSYCIAPSPLHTYMYLSACLPVCATPLRATLYCTPPVRVPLPTVCCGDPHGESHQVLLWSGTSAGTHTHIHHVTRLPALGTAPRKNSYIVLYVPPS